METIFRVDKINRRMVYNIEPLFWQCEPVITRLIYLVLIFASGVILGMSISLIQRG